jgi:uracil-DNA glycosylase
MLVTGSKVVYSKIEELLKFYMETLSDIGDIPISSKTQAIIEEAPQRPSAPVQQNVASKPNVEKKAIVEKLHNVAPPKADLHKVMPPRVVSSIASSKIVRASIDLSTVTTLEELKQKILETQVCELQQFATNTVFGDGNPNAKILIIGEAPGQEEDEQGIPFCGRSGKLLMNAFASIGLKREQNFFLTNNIFWRPPGNRKPTAEELSACKPYIEKIAQIIRPELVICVGAIAAQNVLNTQEAISSLRGKAFVCNIGIETKAFCVYHPSYLLRSPSKKYDMYKDLLTIMPNISHLL